MNNSVNINAGAAVVNIMADASALNDALKQSATQLQTFATVAGISQNYKSDA